MEVARKQAEAGLNHHAIAIPVNSRQCVECHRKSSPRIIDHWTGSTHAEKGVGCVECHRAVKEDVDAFVHYGETIATVVTPRLRSFEIDEVLARPEHKWYDREVIRLKPSEHPHEPNPAANNAN